jgi:hypothetical protein
MDFGVNYSYEELQQIFNRYFSLKFLSTNITDKLALISLTCYLVYRLKEKKPDVTHWSLLYKINNDNNLSIPEDYLKGLAVICNDFSYGCKEFSTFGLTIKEIPKKIAELLNCCLPF